MGWRRRLEEAKQKHRPRLKDWGRDAFATDRKLDFVALNYLPSPHSQHDKPQQHKTGMVDRMHCRDLSPEAFIDQYEKLSKPVIIQGVPEAEGWKATDRWASDGALRRRFRKYSFKCGEDDDGRSIRVRLKHFLKYVGKQKDDSPLYIFDSTFDDDKEAKALLDDYAVPSYFPDDFFSLVGEKRRPPYRWFLVGPRRSGTSLHIDPLGTSAWNTVLTGKKRWILFPPSTPRDLAKGKALYRKGEDDEPINYFADILPRLRALPASEELVFYEFIQEEGETVFVPGGWWHAVLNLEDSVAVTQNFASRVNFSAVWRKTRTGRKKMACRWLKRLEEVFPELAATAKKLNEVDGFRMQSKKEREEAKRKKEWEKKRRRKEKEEEKEKAKEKKRDRRAGSDSSSSSSSSSSTSSSFSSSCSFASATTVAAVREMAEKRKGGYEERDVDVSKRARETN
ncbi:phosphatidylserine receptor [Nannochloropsis oceanica]